MIKSQQLPFDLGSNLAYERDDFWVSKANEAAVSWIDRWPDWSSSAIIIFGEPASGKTHLSQVWKGQSNAIEIKVKEIKNIQIEKFIKDSENIIIENIGDIIGDLESEKIIFHIYNNIKERGGYLLLTSQQPIKNYNFKLADLESRFMSLPIAALTPPDEDLMAVILTKVFSDRQIFVSQKVVNFIVLRLDRSFLAIRDIVKKIDHLSLIEKRSITIPLVKKVIDKS